MFQPDEEMLFSVESPRPERRNIGIIIGPNYTSAATRIALAHALIALGEVTYRPTTFGLFDDAELDKKQCVLDIEPITFSARELWPEPPRECYATLGTAASKYIPQTRHAHNFQQVLRPWMDVHKKRR